RPGRGIDLARAHAQFSREEVAKRWIAAEIELDFVEIRADRARKCAIRQTAKPRRQGPLRTPPHQRRACGPDARTRALGCNASCLAECQAGAGPLMTAWRNAVRNDSILPGAPPSYKRSRRSLEGGVDLYVVIQVELGRDGAHADMVGFVLALVGDPRVDQIR